MSAENVVLKLKDGESTARKAFKLGSYLRAHHKFFSEGGGSPIWMYDETTGIWTPKGTNFIQNFLANYLGTMYKKNLVNEVLSYIRYTSYDEGIELGGPPNKIVMANGVFDLDTYSFDTDFNPDEYHISGIPINYDPEAQCSTIQSFLREILIKKDENGEIPEDANDKNIKAITEFFGYCLYKSYPHAIVLMLLGEGANGKSTLLDLLRYFLGHGNCAACTPQQLAENRFKMAQLRGRLANVGGDIPAKPLQYTGVIKMVTGGDLISAEHKNQDSFDFINHAKMIFSANQLPRAYDTTTAFHRRIRIIDFPNVFPSDDPNTISKDKLVASLVRPEELSGFFLLAVGGLRRLRASGHLTGERTALEKRIAYVKRSDAIEYMALKFIYHDPVGDPIAKDTMYDLYVQLSGVLGLTPTSNTWFAKRIRRVLPFLESKQLPMGPDGQKIWCWTGISVYVDEILHEIDTLRSISGNSGKLGIPLARQSNQEEEYKKEVKVGGKGKNTQNTRSTRSALETDDLFLEEEEFE